MAAHRLCRPWDSPGKNSAVGRHFLLQCMKVKSESKVTQSCLTLSDPMDCSLPGSSIHGIFQARVLEWGAIAFSEVVLYLLLNIFITLAQFWIREGNGTPLQYSCLENPIDGGAWYATVHEVTKSWTRLGNFTSLFLVY